ncbi:MAG: hypothetical protein E7208_03725 [Clostridium butyricum]|nr:hypothetical protein [Clostridium butyricum]
MDREEILKILSSYDLTEEEREYLYLQLYFTEELNNKADEQILELHKQQKENRDSILNEIANIMLSYPIIESIMSIGSSDRIKLKDKLNTLIQDKIQSEVNNETLKTKELLESTGKNKYNINNYINDIGMNVNWDIKPVENETPDEIINDKVENKTWSDRLWDNKNDLQKDLKGEIDNFLNGKTTVNEIEAKIKKKFNSDAYETKRLVQTEIARVQEEINQAWAKEHGVKYQMFMATLDHKTSITCRGLDGKVFEFDDINKSIPPLHPFCRSTLVNMPNKDWRPSQRLDNESKQKISWQTYEEWLDTKENPLRMNLQLFAKKSNWSILQTQINNGSLNLDEAKAGMKYWKKSIRQKIKTPIETIKHSKKSVHQYWHILEDHKEFLKPKEINNIIECLKNPDEIRLSFGKNVYIKNINGNELLTIVNNDIITAYYPTKRYLNNNIKKKVLVWQK